MRFVMPELIEPLSYGSYNYDNNLAGYLRRIHFEAALGMTSEYFHTCDAIDFGCADGPFLPSLSNYYDHVVGIEKERDLCRLLSSVEKAKRLVGYHPEIRFEGGLEKIHHWFMANWDNIKATAEF